MTFTVDREGNLILQVNGGAAVLHQPNVYQEIKGKKQFIAARYIARTNQSDERLTNNVSLGIHVGIQVAAYDVKKPLIIDPVLFYSSYLGGSGGDSGLGIAVDTAGNAYVTGSTGSADFPTTAGAFHTLLGGTAGRSDAFVTKLNSTGSGLVYSTYLGGSLSDIGNGIAVDSLNNAYVTGGTSSTDFPTTSGAFQTSNAGGFDVFVTTLNPTGSGLVYSTYLGGSGSSDFGQGIAVDTAGNAYVIGITNSTNFPTLGAVQPTFGGGSKDAFVTKLNSSGSGLVYSTYLGGSGEELGLGIAVDSLNNAYVTGATRSPNFPTTSGAFQTSNAATVNAFVTKLTPTGSALVYSTYLGGSGGETGTGIAVDTAGNAYVTGNASSTDFPTLGAVQPTFGGNQDAFVTKLNSSGAGLVYSTYLGGSDGDEGDGIAVDSLNNAYVTGGTSSTDFPTTSGAFQTSNAGGFDVFVTKLNPTGAALVYSTYLGGSDEDTGFGIAVDSLNNAYVTGPTSSTDFPTTSGAFQTSNAGGDDAFVAKIIDVVLPPAAPGKVTGGGTVNVPGGIGNFGFIVQREVAGGPISGDLNYHNKTTGAKVKSVSFTSFFITGNMAVFEGTCTKNGAPCTVKVSVMDNGEPGTADTFTISVSAGPTEGGTLRSGNIQIHQ